MNIYGNKAATEATRMMDKYDIDLDLGRHDYFKATTGNFSMQVYGKYLTVKSKTKYKKVEATHENICKALNWISEKVVDSEADEGNLAQWISCLQDGGYDRAY